MQVYKKEQTQKISKNLSKPINDFSRKANEAIFSTDSPLQNLKK